MKITPTAIAGCFIVQPKTFEDHRGSFTETFNGKVFKEATGLEVQFVQDNQSISRKKVLRGLHFQKSPYAQSKLVRSCYGKIQDVCVDLRKDSPSFGKWISVILDNISNEQLFIPKGCAHGFLTLSDYAVVAYKCDEFYYPEMEGGVLFNDPDLKIDWMIPDEEIILSEKDQKMPLLSDVIK